MTHLVAAHDLVVASLSPFSFLFFVLVVRESHRRDAHLGRTARAFKLLLVVIVHVVRDTEDLGFESLLRLRHLLVHYPLNSSRLFDVLFRLRDCFPPSNQVPCRPEQALDHPKRLRASQLHLPLPDSPVQPPDRDTLADRRRDGVRHDAPGRPGVLTLRDRPPQLRHRPPSHRLRRQRRRLQPDAAKVPHAIASASFHADKLHNLRPPFVFEQRTCE
mmetsp:Transcript_5448/g.16488  ORF Transcript_5448/g.16488 Transcript_5448/m.16488 type:complete len:217 (-) Transcript_5448:89-739(-)